jgi:hypothetical protein
MMKSFRLNQETHGTVAGECHRIMIAIPEGSEILLVGQVAEQPESVEVLWNGQSVWLFASDFRARAIEDATIVPLTRAVSVGGDERKVGIPADVKNPGTPKIRRFNAAGRELF